MKFKEITVNHLFLSEHVGIKDFIKCFTNDWSDSIDSQNKNHNQQFSIICERFEDIRVVQKQVVIELERIFGKKIDILGGISFYTLDQIGRNFCASLAISQNQKTKNSLPKFIYKPYVDVIKQEQIVSVILTLFHLSSHNNSILAQQILSLLDIPLPPDTNLVEMLLNALDIKTKKIKYKDISDVFLKQILASFQASYAVLNRFARLQSLVWNFLQGLTDEFIHDHLVYFPKFLFGNILWIGAPEYENSNEHTKNFRPGDFLSSLVDDLFASILRLRIKNPYVKDTIFIHQRTILKSTHSFLKNLGHLTLYCASNRHEFYKSALYYSQFKDNSTNVLTAEFNSQMFQTVQENGGGAYKLLKKDFLNWKTKNNSDFFSEAISNQLDAKYEDFLDTISYIENYSKLSEIAQIYSIPIREFSDSQIDEIFYSSMKFENFSFKPNEYLSNLSKSYSFFSSSCVPKQIVVLWDTDHTENTSFLTRILNQMFSYLKSYGVDIDNPFVDKKFTLFWTHVVGLIEFFENIKIDFIVDSKKSLENFPVDLKNKKYFSLNNKFNFSATNNTNTLSNQKILNIQFNDFWLKTIFDQVNINEVSTTQFDIYVRCPFQFFLQFCLKLIPERPKSVFEVDPQTLGTKAHKICDLLLSEMVEMFGNDGYIRHAGEVYEKVLSVLQTPNLFLSVKNDVWKNALNTLDTQKQSIFFKVFDEIFDCVESSLNSTICAETNAESAPLDSILFLEMLKRIFVKFLQTEIKSLKLGNKFRVGIVREYPFEVKLGKLMIRGRIDRVDLNQNGYEVIDYKVSPIPKSEKTLCILPSEMLSLKHKAIASVQGAIYALAFGKKVFDANEKEDRLSAFSLYRLKNSVLEDSAILTYSFDEPCSSELNTYAFSDCQSGIDQIKIIEKELYPYAEKFVNRQFLPHPILNKQTCQYCSFQNMCPYFMKESDKT